MLVVKFEVENKIGNWSQKKLIEIFKKKSFFIIIILLTSVIINIYFILSIAIYNNSLHNSGNWTNIKTEVSRANIGAASFMNTMPALFKFRLNLSKWQGYHKLIFNREIFPKEVSFKYRIDDKQYFSFLFSSNKDGSKSSGFRISNNELYPSIFFHLENDNYLDKQPIPNFKSDISLHTFRIKFLFESILIYIDDKEVFSFKESLPKKMHIGFKAGLEDIRSDVDDLKIIQEDDSQIEETFFYWNIIPKVSIYSILASIFFLSILYFLLKLKFRAEQITILKYISYINFNILLFSFLVFTAMYSHISRIYFTAPRIYEGYPVIPFTGEVINEILAKYSNNKSNKTRLWFVGSSQTWGEGVYKEEDTFVRRIESKLNETNKNIECINGGIAGFTSIMALDLYKENFDKIKPDFLIINFSHNDAIFEVSTENFVKNLKEFISINKKNNVITVFIIEPVEIQFKETNKHQNAMRELAVESNIDLIDMHKEMSIQYDDGFIWWDKIHLTSYGNSIFAEILFTPLKKIVLKHNR